MVPWQALNMLGFRVDVVCPGKRTGEFIKTAIHDFEGDQTYTEKPGHLFRLTASFDDIRLQEYSGVYISGGRSSEYLRLNKSVLDIVHYAMNLTLPVAAICHGPQILAAAGVLKGRKLTGYFTVKPEVEMAGGQWVTCLLYTSQPPDDTSHHFLQWHATAFPVFTHINRYQNAE